MFIGKRIRKKQHGSSSYEHLGDTAKFIYWASFDVVKTKRLDPRLTS